MLEALAVIDITRIVSQVWATNHLTISLVLAVITGGHNHMSISGLKDLIRHYILVSITKTFGGHARGHVIEILVGQQSHMRIQQSNIKIGRANVLNQVKWPYRMQYSAFIKLYNIHYYSL